MSLFKEQILLEGLMPERALLRLRRAGISVYKLQKPQKNRLLFTVNKKDVEKVFAIYPDVCYNVSVYTPYKAKRLGSVGLAKKYENIKRRVGLLLGGLLGLAIIAYADTFVFSVEFVGADVYKRESVMLLEKGGIKPFAPYDSKNIDWICAQMLSLDGVEYCSVKKSGLKAVVEIRTSPFKKPALLSGNMYVKRSGKIQSISVLRGTPMKKAGDEVRENELLVGGWIENAEGERASVSPVARVCIVGTFETDVQADSEEEAFAKAYLYLGLNDGDSVLGLETVKNQDMFHVKISYRCIEKINM